MAANRILLIKHAKNEGPGTIEDFFRNTAWNLQEIELSRGEKLPSGLEGIDAVISMGGPMNAYDEEKYPFLKDEDTFLKQALKEGAPVLGICLGAQLLAKALGARIKKSPVKEIGWYMVSLTKNGLNDALFDNVAPYFDVFQWHEDTFDIPKGALHLAQSENCRNQAFRFGQNAYGLQFHIETTPDMVEEWLNYSSMSKSARDDILLDAYRKYTRFEKRAQIIFLNFSKIIKSSRKAAVC